MEETEQLLINKEITPSLFVGNVRKDVKSFKAFKSHVTF